MAACPVTCVPWNFRSYRKWRPSTRATSECVQLSSTCGRSHTSRARLASHPIHPSPASPVNHCCSCRNRVHHVYACVSTVCCRSWYLKKPLNKSLIGPRTCNYLLNREQRQILRAQNAALCTVHVHTACTWYKCKCKTVMKMHNRACLRSGPTAHVS